jgi:hypothetical protein
MRLGFADESGTDDNPGCYGIGVLSFPEERRPAFDALFAELRETHKLTSEQKWELIKTGHARMNFLLDWLHQILSSSAATLDVIIVSKRLFRLWNEVGGDREKAFYKTYTQILAHVAKRTGDEMRVFIDDRSDAYGLHPEVVQIVGNHMLRDLANAGRLGEVTKVNSKEEPAIQVADLLTGAITAAHRARLDPTFELHPGKALVIERLAGILGWSDLVCDTLPGSRFNIWHFPIEYRASPETRNVGSVHRPHYVTKLDIDRLGARIPESAT